MDRGRSGAVSQASCKIDFRQGHEYGGALQPWTLNVSRATAGEIGRMRWHRLVDTENRAADTIRRGAGSPVRCPLPEECLGDVSEVMPDLTSDSPSVRSQRVLVVEDEHLVALYLEDALESLGYVCCGIAATAEDAVAITEAERPVAALVDIGLRGKSDGIALACELRERFRVSVIFLSGATDAETRQRAETAQPRGFLSKPCLEHELAEALGAALRGPPPS